MSRYTNRSINNLDTLLLSIYENYVKISDQDFALHYEVFDTIFKKLHEKMKDVDRYYARYSSKVQAMGSHYDRLRIIKPDEFDIFNVILLPPEVEKYIVVRPEQASFVFLEINENCKMALRESQNWEVNKQMLEWVDGNGRLQRSKFFDWFKGVVDKALNAIRSEQHRGSDPFFVVNGERYTVKRSETGPAVTLKITNIKSFYMDVDFVPSIKFPSELWPANYRPLPSRNYNNWMVVAKPDKNREEAIRNVQWRIALPEQERDLMYTFLNYRLTMKLLKKLRDTQGMKKLASYFLKQLVFSKLDQGYGATFFNQPPAILFTAMVVWLHEAVKKGKIPYYWHSKNNLLQRVDPSTLKVYENTLYHLIKVLENPSNYMKVADYLLTSEELHKFEALRDC